jgi:hypothetical protein
MPTDDSDLPSTLRRSDEKIQRTFLKTKDSAEETYDSAEAANRVAWASVKHVAEKTGDHWELKDEPGASDAQAAKGGAAARRGGETKGGVDAGASKQELYEKAKDAGIEGRSKMSKDELADALSRYNDRETARARREGR